MTQKPVVFLLVFSILAYLFLLSFAGYRIFAARSAAIEESERDFSSLRQLAGSALAQGKEVGSKIFLEQMRTRYAVSPRLVAVSVRDISGTLSYAIPASSMLTAPPPGKSKLPRFVSELLDSASNFSIHRLSSPIGLPDTKGRSIEAIYAALPTGTALAAIRDSLIGTVGLVFISGIVLLVFALTENDSTASPAFAPEGAAFDASRSSFPQDQGLGEEFQVPAFSMDEAAQGPPRTAPQGLYSPRSGLGWESYLQERLDAELSRCASLGLDCAFLLIDSGQIRPENPEYREIAASIQDFFTFRDISFERGESGFAVILPGKNIEQALKSARDFHSRLPHGILIGLSSRSGRIVDSGVMLRESEAALEKAGITGDSPVVGFKADPELYKNFISGKL